MGRLGEACQITAVVTAKSSDRIILANTPIAGWWTNRYCRTGEAELQFVVPSGKDCLNCDGYNQLDDWSLELRLNRNGKLGFVGPITRLDFQAERILVRAEDLSAWWGVRPVGTNNFVDTDLATIFEAYHQQAMLGDPVVGMQTAAIPTGILSDRSTVVDTTLASEAIRSITEEGCPWTMNGRFVLVNNFAKHLPTLTDQFWSPAPTVIHEGRIRASKIILTGGTGTVPAVATADAAYIAQYGLIVRFPKAPEITDQTSLQQMADALLEYARYPQLIDTPRTSTMTPDTPICYEDMIPGSTVTVDTSSSCRTLNADFIIDEKRTNIDGTVQLSLAPVGARTSGRFFWPKNLGDLFRQIASSL